MAAVSLIGTENYFQRSRINARSGIEIPLLEGVAASPTRSGSHKTPETFHVRNSHDFRPENETPPPERRSYKPFAKAAFVLVAAVLTASFQPWKLARSTAATVESLSMETPRTVTIDRPSRATSATVVLPATLRPWQTTSLSARVSGFLSAWHRDLGAQVKAGELLAILETPELDQEVSQGEALASEAIAAVAQAKAEEVEAQADLKVAESQLVRIQSELALARSQLVRREKLLVTRSVSQEEYETSQKQVEARAADLSAGEADIARRRANLETRAAIVVAREATANSRRANVARLKELQRFKRIVAPFDGVVTRRAAEVGMLVTAGKEVLFVIEDVSRIRVQMNVPQTYSAQTLPGVAAQISLPESSAAPLRGAITRVAESVDAANRTMLAEIELENETHRIQPGTYAQVTLTMSESGESWTIPSNAVAMRVNGPHVGVVNDQNQVEIRRIRLGRDLGNRIVVAGGIQGDERLVVNPGDDLTDGVTVQIAPRHETGVEMTQR